jgi:hypothetical protein
MIRHRAHLGRQRNCPRRSRYSVANPHQFANFSTDGIDEHNDA